MSTNLATPNHSTFHMPVWKEDHYAVPRRTSREAVGLVGPDEVRLWLMIAEAMLDAPGRASYRDDAAGGRAGDAVQHRPSEGRGPTNQRYMRDV